MVFENAKSFLDNATVVIDGSGSKDFRAQLERYPKRRINDPTQHIIKKVKVQDSSRNNLLSDYQCSGVDVKPWGHNTSDGATEFS